MSERKKTEKKAPTGRFVQVQIGTELLAFTVGYILGAVVTALAVHYL